MRVYRSYSETIPQSALLTAPFAQESLFVYSAKKIEIFDIGANNNLIKY